MLTRPPHILQKLAETRYVETAPVISRAYTHVALIDREYEKDDILAIPYNIIVCGQEAIKLVQDIVHKFPERSEQIIGVYCTNDDEKTAAQSIKSNITIGMNNEFESLDLFIKSIKHCENVTIWRVGDTLPQFHIVTQIWKHPNPLRLEELQVALYKNATNNYIHKIHVLLEGDDSADVLSKIPTHLMSKIVYVPISGRLNYKSAMEYLATLPSTDFGALINTDIYFDNTIRWLWNIPMKNKCIALLRYESTTNYALNGDGKQPEIFGPRSDSQDAWIFSISDLKEHLEDGESWDELDFNLGVPGCDNAIAGELLRRKWVVTNPAYSIKAYHLHDSALRSYNLSDLVSLGFYHLIIPSSIE